MSATWRSAVLVALVARAAPGQGVVTTVSGAVYDSVAQRRVAGAIVQLVRADRPGESRTMRTGSDGAYRFDSVATGSWLLGFFDAATDSLDLTTPVLRVTIVDATPVRAMLATPAPRSIITRTCGSGSDSTGLWYGRVRDARTGIPIDSATVVAQWSTITARGAAISRQTPVLSMVTTAEGTFGLCGLPLDESVLALAHRYADSTGVTTLTFPRHGLLHRDLFVAPLRSVERAVVDSASGDTLRVSVLTGDGQLRGRVTRRGGQPIAGARLRVAEAAREVTTNQEGYYALDSLPLGTRLLDARALGFQPALRAVDLLGTAAVVADLELDPRQVFLDTVKVVTRRLYDTPQYQDFLRRKRNGFGHFYDEDELERINPTYLSDAIRRFPGVYVMGGGFGGNVLFRSASLTRGMFCTPAVFVDGLLMAGIEGFSLDQMVNAEDVRGVEVYTRTAGMPAQYQTMNGCGSLVLWTGGRRRRLPP